jgi:integrase
MSTVTATPSTMHPGEQAFAQWGAAQCAQDELSPGSVLKYKPLWMAWLGWCSSVQVPWDQVHGPDVQRFLDGPAPGKGVSRRLAINPQRMSAYTRQRYWRLLRGVYATAFKAQLVQHNPALEVDDKDRPSIHENDRLSQVLEPFVFEKLQQAHTLEAIFTPKTPDNWWYARDRAILAILLETGITVSELIALRGSDLIEPEQGRAVASSSVQDSLLGHEPGELRLDVMQSSTTVGRTLAIKAAMAPLVRAWLAWREKLLIERSGTHARLIHRRAFMQEHSLRGPLFIARRARKGIEIFPIMDATSVYYTVSNALTRLRTLEHLENELYVAKGPGIIRNSVIRHWISAYGPEAAAAMAGLQSVASLRLGTSKA